jgi:hypothetical protein
VNKFFYLALILIAGCSSSTTVGTNVKVAANNSAVVDKSIASEPVQPNVNAEPPSNIVIQNTTVRRDNIRNYEGKKGRDTNTAPIAPNVDKNLITAPDNSEVSSGMNDQGEPLETRVFNRHPVLAKIERINLNNKSVKVYLKNGKTLILPEEKANDFLTATANDILKAVGVN